MITKPALILLIIGCFYIPANGHNSELPGGLERCSVMDDQCVAKGVRHVLKNYAKSGIKDLGLVPLDPLHIKKMNMGKNANSPVSIDLKFHEVDLVGLQNANIKSVSGFSRDLTKPIELVMEVPEIAFQGPYAVEGRVLILPIVGKGSSKIVLTNCQIVGKLKFKAVSKDEHHTFADLIDVKLLINPAHVSYKLDGLFNGDKALSDNMHVLINENWQDIYNELRGSISEALSLIIKAVLNRVFNKLPLEELFLDV
ncbi:protein takeout [Drosophila willistoni]|nr:protein takeout [Drosophila willistoni]